MLFVGLCDREAYMLHECAGMGKPVHACTLSLRQIVIHQWCILRTWMKSADQLKIKFTASALLRDRVRSCPSVVVVPAVLGPSGWPALLLVSAAAGVCVEAGAGAPLAAVASDASDSLCTIMFIFCSSCMGNAAACRAAAESPGTCRHVHGVFCNSFESTSAACLHRPEETYKRWLNSGLPVSVKPGENTALFAAHAGQQQMASRLPGMEGSRAATSEQQTVLSSMSVSNSGFTCSWYVCTSANFLSDAAMATKLTRQGCANNRVYHYLFQGHERRTG